MESSNERKLELTLCGMLPYKLNVEYKSSEQISRDKWIDTINVVEMTSFYLGVNRSNVTPLLHSLDKLTEPILEGGLIPIVELAKIALKYKGVPDHPWELFFDGVGCGCRARGYEINFWFENGVFQYSYKKQNRFVDNQFQLFEKLKEMHFNVFDIPKEMYIEKPTSNNNQKQ